MGSRKRPVTFLPIQYPEAAQSADEGSISKRPGMYAGAFRAKQTAASDATLQNVAP
jgi:hypothetical protein